ncbi:MAG: ferredoxin [Hyphomicrobiaceae bacterium]|jgi:ferredoxin
MATVITDDCINCGACEPECPNVAIYQGGVEYDWAGQQNTALSEDFFYIVPEKCTECVGFFDQEACAAVCPVDCCIPDPERPEGEAALLVRAKELHPETAFSDDFPSRFKGEGGDAAAAAPAAPAAASSAASAAPKAAPAPVAVAVTGSARVERAVRPPRTLAAGDPSREFKGELGESFESILERLEQPRTSGSSTLVGLGLLAASPLLGALGHNAKKSLETAFGDRRFFSNEMATGLNMIQNFLAYPVLLMFVWIGSGMQAFTEADRMPIILGLLAAIAESCWRLRDGFRGIAVNEMRMGPSIYGAPLSLVAGPLIRSFSPERVSGHVPFDGFFTDEFDAKRERERRYGRTYQVRELGGGYHINFELPRIVPRSGAKEELGIGDEMPDYQVSVSLDEQGLVIRGNVVDDQLRALCGVSSAFPADFRTEIALTGNLGGFRHRYANKILEIIVPRLDV